MLFNNGTQFEIDIPRRLDPNQNEKWPVTVPLAEADKYATVHTKDFTVLEKANFSESAGQVTGTTESGKSLRHYRMAQRDSDREVCSGSISGIATTGINGTATFCYTDELRNISCANKKDKEPISFTMRCSEIQIERFGGNRIFNNDSIWSLNHLASGTRGVGSKSLMQMNSLRGYKKDNVSPSSMVVAAVLTEFPSQVVLVERPFFVDVSVVVVPDWLIYSSAAVVVTILLSSFLASTYSRVMNMVTLSSWQELLISNLLEPLDCLNRANKNEFRCVIGADHDPEKRYRFYVEPHANIAPVCFIREDDIG